MRDFSTWLGLILMSLFLVVVSLPINSAAESRAPADDMGYCECACIDANDEELCDRVIVDEDGPYQDRGIGTCDVWATSFPNSPISFCERLNGTSCGGVTRGPLGWQEARGIYHCYWSEE